MCRSTESCAGLVKAAVTHWVNMSLADLPSHPTLFGCGILLLTSTQINTMDRYGPVSGLEGGEQKRLHRTYVNNGVTQ